MWSISEVKERGKTVFKANYWKSVLVALILSVCAGGAGAGASNSVKSEDLQEQFSSLSPEQLTIIIFAVLGVIGVAVTIGELIKIFALNPLSIGCYGFFKDNNKTDGRADFNVLLDGFKNNYLHNVLTVFLKDLFLALWTCLFIIPGIIMAYAYRMVPYILRDNPELAPMEVIKKSKEMMKGNKWQAFVYDLSFIGWILLTIITCGIVGVFYLSPYKENADAQLYMTLSGQNNAVASNPYDSDQNTTF